MQMNDIEKLIDCSSSDWLRDSEVRLDVNWNVNLVYTGNNYSEHIVLVGGASVKFCENKRILCGDIKLFFCNLMKVASRAAKWNGVLALAKIENCWLLK